MARSKRGNHAYVDIDDPENATPDDWSTNMTASGLDDTGEVIDGPRYYIKAAVAQPTAEKWLFIDRAVGKAEAGT